MKHFTRLISALPVRLYQWGVSPILAPSCRYLPTCSAYAIEAIEVHGPIKGIWLTLARLARCHPWGGEGFDPVPGPDRHAHCRH